MKNLPIRVPDKALVELKDVFIPENASMDDQFELSIRISEDNVEIRDMSAFLSFIDRIYGRLSEKGLRSYAQRESGHLQISQMRRGSLELLLIETLASPQSVAILVVFLALKYLPSGVQSFANAYNEVEQGRLARENRKRILQEMEEDQKLANLSPIRRKQVSELIEYLHEQEHDELPRAIRFSRRRLLSLCLRIRSKDQSGS